MDWDINKNKAQMIAWNLPEEEKQHLEKITRFTIFVKPIKYLGNYLTKHNDN